MSDLKLLGIALRLQWLWLHYTDASRSWSARPLHVDQTTQAFFKALVKCVLGDGKIILFWSDPWLDGGSILDLMPELGDAVPPRRQRRTRMVPSTLHQNNWICDIMGLLTVPVLMQDLSLVGKIQDTMLDHSTPDKLEWRWCVNDTYSSKSSYLAKFYSQSGVPGAKEV
jgi:hypothetical protein